MRPVFLPSPVQAYAPDFTRRLGLILTALAAVIARRFLRDPKFSGLIVPLWTRLTRAVRRVEGLMARFAAGTMRKPHRSGASPSASPRPRRTNPLPSGKGWLVAALGSEAAVYARQLETLLAEPQAAALLAAAPAARRIIRPIGHLLGLSACAYARCPRAPRPPKPRPPPLPPIRPTSPYPSAKWPWLDRSFRKRD